MSSNKSWSLVASRGMAIAIVAAGCSSSSTGPSDAGGEGSTVIHRDAGNVGITDDGGGAEASVGVDGTVGKACTTDVDCAGANGPGANKCSSTLFTSGPLYPTPVCVGQCTPVQDGFIHYCDGPDTSTSPGICEVNSGLCLPQCTIPSDGSPASGCQKNDACNLTGWGVGGGQVSAVGLCFGGCSADAECPTGAKCETSTGVCVKTVRQPTKMLGQSCTSADATNGVCNCLASSGKSGYCSKFCVVGSTTAACPAGYVCDSQLPAVVTGANDAAVAGFTVQNAGLAGLCVATCGASSGDAGSGDAAQLGEAGASLDGAIEAGEASTGDAASGGASSCPANSTCSMQNTAGPDCLPP